MGRALPASARPARPRGAPALAGAALALTLALPGLAGAKGSGHWSEKAPLPIGRAEVGVAVLDGKIYLVGGTEQRGQGPLRWDSPLNTAYDPARDAWQERAPLPRGLSHVGVAALGGKLYAVGGFINIVHEGAQDLAFAYDPKTNQWSALPRLSSPRAAMAAVAVGGKLHVFGGRGRDKVTVTTHEVYDPASGRWSTAAPVPRPARDHLGAVVLDGKVHLVGGRTVDFVDNVDRHDVYDPASDTWTTAAPLPRPRSAGAATVLNGAVLYAGGECKPGGKPSSPDVYDDVTAYDAKTGRWTALAPLPRGRHALGAATVGGVAYFVGGAAVCGGGALTDTLALTLP